MAAALRADEELMYEGQPKGFPFGNFNVEDVMLPEGDDMGIPSEDEAEEEQEIQSESGFGNVILIDGLPQAGADKYGKLTAILQKIAGGVGPVREGGVTHPVDSANGQSKGYAMVEYESPEAARAAAAALDGYALDKNHRFTAVLFDEAERVAAVPDEWTPPEARPAAAMQDAMGWLGDARARDQFMARHGDDTEIYWNDVPKQQGELVYARPFWTDSFVEWTPQGSLLCTLHRQGVALWGGADFARFMRMQHSGVLAVAFSGDERFCSTFAEPLPGPQGHAHGPPSAFSLCVWDARSGEKLRAWEGPQADYAVGAAARPDGGLAWNAFKWSGGQERPYLAHLKRGAVAVYEAPEFHLLDKKPMRVPNVQLIEWSPADPLLAAYQAEEGNLPARVAVFSLPSREELRAKNLFSVAGVALSWHPQGDYLAVQVDKWTKSHKSTTTNFELFSLRERDTPIDMMELPSRTEKVHALAWEPKGVRFAVLHGDGAKVSVSVYSMRGSGGGLGARGVELVVSWPNKQASTLAWSPQGRYLVLAGTKHTHGGVLEFWDVDEKALLSAGEHFGVTAVNWDPSGRYVATIVDASNSMDNGFRVWSFAGALLYKFDRDRFFQFAWRPRPPTLLSNEQVADIQKNLRRYAKRYEEEDEALLVAADSEFVAERNKLLDEWKTWHGAKLRWAKDAQANGVVRPPVSDFTIQKVEVSVIVDQKEEIVKMA
ncbi:eukaryotic translation initiation factor eIF2A [Helicosporidium sp. ATCC 50920]|nr:eukaryotic translation initiation factor eIF2A [Helicosporidium sp. ATCC 50920]|eukprot:KDD76724.1 eukaryotic translation initiation factor eIF2A [Helicosporidium sp. ATCC 50920]